MRRPVARIGIAKRNCDTACPVYLDMRDGKAVLNIPGGGNFYEISDRDLKRIKVWINDYFENKEWTAYQEHVEKCIERIGTGDTDVL